MLFFILTVGKYINMLNYRRSTQGMQGKGDYHGRGRLNTQEADRWQNKCSNADSPVIPSTHLETSNVEHAHHTSVEATEKPASYPHGRGEGESVPPDLDSNDSQAQVICLIFIPL